MLIMCSTTEYAACVTKDAVVLLEITVLSQELASSIPFSPLHSLGYCDLAHSWQPILKKIPVRKSKMLDC